MRQSTIPAANVENSLETLDSDLLDDEVVLLLLFPSIQSLIPRVEVIVD